MSESAPILVNSLSGIHARPAAIIVKTLHRFSSEVSVSKDGEAINGRSIMGLMMLAAGPGSVIEISAEGVDSEQAISAFNDIADYGFGDYDQRIDDIYLTWQDFERQRHGTYVSLQKRFCTTTGLLEFDRLAIGDLPHSHGAPDFHPGVLAVIEGIYILDENYVSSQEWDSRQCSDLAKGGRYILYDGSCRYSACINIVENNQPEVGASIFRALASSGRNGDLCAIAFELLSKRGIFAVEESINLCRRHFGLINTASLLRLLKHSKEVETFINATLADWGEEALAHIAFSSGCLVNHKELFHSLQEKVFAAKSSFPRHRLADAAVCTAHVSIDESLSILERLLKDSAFDVRWRATNALRKIQGFGYSVPQTLVQVAACDSSRLVRCEACRSSPSMWNTPSS